MPDIAFPDSFYAHSRINPTQRRFPNQLSEDMAAINTITKHASDPDYLIKVIGLEHPGEPR